MSGKFPTAVCSHCDQEIWRQGGFTRRTAAEEIQKHFRRDCQSELAKEVRAGR